MKQLTVEVHVYFFSAVKMNKISKPFFSKTKTSNFFFDYDFTQRKQINIGYTVNFIFIFN